MKDLEAATTDHPPILVYTMGKVGSLSVAESLLRAEIDNPVYHLHYIAGETPERLKRRLRIRGYKQNPYYHAPEAIRAFLYETPNPIRFPWKIITLAREPIVRRLSAYFHMPQLVGGHPTDEMGRFIQERALEFLSQELRRPNAFVYSRGWFDAELKTVFDVDVLSLPFDKKEGFAIHHAPKADVLVMTQEKLAEVFDRAIVQLLPFDKPPDLPRVNTGDARLNALAYRWVKERFRLEEDLLRQIYSHKSVTHFYDEETIENWVQYWSSPD